MKRSLSLMVATVAGLLIFASCSEDSPIQRPANIPAQIEDAQCVVKQQLTIGAGATQSMKMEISINDFAKVKSYGQEIYKWIDGITYTTGKPFAFKINSVEKTKIKKLTIRCSGKEYVFDGFDVPGAPTFTAKQLVLFEDICAQLQANGKAQLDYTIENGDKSIKNDESKTELNFFAAFKMKTELK